MQAEKDTGQISTNPHIIAARIIADVRATGRMVTHTDINTVLENQGYSITAEELDQLKAIPYNTYSFADTSLIIKALKTLYPKMPKGEGQ